MINRFGLSRYPGTVGGLIAVDDWFDTYTESPPLGIPDWFKDTDTYKDTLIDIGGKQLQTTVTWPLLLFANLLDKNTDGLNGILDGVIDSVFGTSFNEAVTRAGKLAYADSIVLDSEIAEALGLNSLFEGNDIYIGKAELDLLISSLRIVKATLEWIAAYDWNTGDLSFLKANWDEDLLDISNLSGILPLKTDFLKARSNDSMEESRQDFIQAIQSTVAAYDYYIGTNSNLPTGVKTELNKYQWVKTGLIDLQTAINSRSTFYVKASSGGSYVSTIIVADAKYGIDMAKFFNPGQLAIAKLVETESDGKSPQFYGFDDKDDPIKITKTADFESYEAVGFKFTLNPVKEIVVKGLELPSDDDLFQGLIPSDIGEKIYGLYHK
jgi:hypothetical protein